MWNFAADAAFEIMLKGLLRLRTLFGKKQDRYVGFGQKRSASALMRRFCRALMGNQEGGDAYGCRAAGTFGGRGLGLSGR